MFGKFKLFVLVYTLIPSTRDAITLLMFCLYNKIFRHIITHIIKQLRNNLSNKMKRIIICFMEIFISPY